MRGRSAAGVAIFTVFLGGCVPEGGFQPPFAQTSRHKEVRDAGTVVVGNERLKVQRQILRNGGPRGPVFSDNYRVIVDGRPIFCGKRNQCAAAATQAVQDIRKTEEAH